MVAAGAHPKYLQTQMRHSSIRVTLDLYGHVFPDANRGVLDSFDALTAPSTPHRRNAARTALKGKVLVSRDFKMGATGLEPATSGVTGRGSVRTVKNSENERRRIPHGY
jgi:hypothetical protein